MESVIYTGTIALKIRYKMKYRVKKTMSLLMMGCIVAMSCAVFAGCRSDKTMYGRKQSNEGVTVKSNYKVKGSTKAPSTKKY